MKPILLILTLLLTSFSLQAQTDFPALKQQFLDYRKADQQDSALFIARKMNTLALKEQTDTSYWYALSMRYQGNPHNTWGNTDSTIYYWNEAVLLFEKYHPRNKDYATSLSNLGILYADMGDYKSAEPYYKQALEIRKKALGEEHPSYAGSLNNLGNLYLNMGDYKSAEAYYKQALEIKKKALGVELDLADIYFNLGLCKFNQKQFSEAEKYIQQSIQTTTKLIDSLNQENKDLIDLHIASSILFAEIGYELKENSVAELRYLNAIKWLELKFGVSNPICYQIYYEFSHFYFKIHSYLKSIEFTEICLGISKTAASLIDYAYDLNNLASLYGLINNHDKELELLIKAKNICENNSLKESKEYIDISGNLAMLFSLKNNLKDATFFIEEKMTQIKVMYDKSSIEYLNAEYDYANYFFISGDKKKAELLIDEILLKIKEKKIETRPEFEFIHKLICYKAIFRIEDKNFVSAIELYNQAIMFGDSIQENYFYNYDCYRGLGVCYDGLALYEASEKMFIKSIEILKTYKNPVSDDLIRVLIGYSSFLANSKQYSKGINLIDSYNLLDEQSYSYTKTSLAWNYFVLNCRNNNYTNALSFLHSYYINLKNNLTLNFAFLSNEEKEKYWKKQDFFFIGLNDVSFKIEKKIPSVLELTYNANLISKSLLLETSRELNQTIAQSSDENLKAQFNEMKQLRRICSKMQSEGSTNKDIMERYKTQADSLDKILVNKLGEYAASKRKFEITWKDVQSNLSTSDAAIEFARYYDAKDSLYKYMALVVRPDYEYPKLISLGEEDVIRSAALNKNFSILYNEAWKGIDSLLVGVKRVYYSPAGELNNVSFLALCTDEGNELVASNKDKNRGVVIDNNKTTTKACNEVLMDKYELHQLTTTRYLADGTLKKEKPMQPSVVLVGGINFDDIPEQTKDADKEQSNEDFAFHANLNKRTASANEKKRGKRSSSNYGKKMDPLPGTKEEVVNIAGLLNTSNWKVQTKSDKKAGEYEFKKELETKAPGVLHIATHGFAFPDEAKKESKLLDMNQTSTYKVSEDPMVRCGLMLGGSNISWTGNPQKMIEQTGDDGILTAAEVANLDLSNTKLVVLSACETGLGKIEGSEGTFGLKRGFKLAGVEQIIVSLWSVPDKETMELMTLFYSDLTKTLNPVNSFENAQKKCAINTPQTLKNGRGLCW